MTQETPQNIQKENYSKVIPIWKFILLSVITFGIYELVWFYRNWKFLKSEQNLKITPLLRTIFASIFAWSFASYQKKFLNEKNIAFNYSPILIWVSYFVFRILWKLPDPYSLLSYLTFVPLIPLVVSMNKYWLSIEQNLAPKKFSWWQIILIILGLIFFLLIVFASFLPE